MQNHLVGADPLALYFALLQVVTANQVDGKRNDNPYSESLFKTLKYRPEYPNKPFTDLAAARAWVEGFVRWYNYEHRHSAIRFVTPAERHHDFDVQILLQRQMLYETIRAEHRAAGRHRRETGNGYRSFISIQSVLLPHNHVAGTRAFERVGNLPRICRRCQIHAFALAGEQIEVFHGRAFGSYP